MTDIMASHKATETDSHQIKRVFRTAIVDNHIVTISDSHQQYYLRLSSIQKAH